MAEHQKQTPQIEKQVQKRYQLELSRYQKQIEKSVTKFQSLPNRGGNAR